MSGLTPAQEDYFRILESMNPSPDLQRAIDAAKDELAARNRLAEYVKLARDKPRRRLMRRFRAWLGR